MYCGDGGGGGDGGAGGWGKEAYEVMFWSTGFCTFFFSDRQVL